MRPSPAFALCALLMLGAAPIPERPPLDPAGETPITPQRTPHAPCVAAVLQGIASSHGRLERSLVTRSRRWGEVWRADFASEDGEANLVNRAVCWNGEMQIAKAQAIAPLPISVGAAGGVRCLYTPVDNPCRSDPVEILWLCVRPGLYLYPSGSSEPAGDEAGLGAKPINHGPAETDAEWAARCEAHGGMLRPEDLP